MILTENNYYSSAANKKYMSVSQYKQFRKCEASAIAQMDGRWEQPKSTALLVGSYVDSYFEGPKSFNRFCENNPEIFKKDGLLKADYVQAQDIIRRIEADDLFSMYMSGKKQEIFTAELFGVPWKIKIDSLRPDSIVDLKIMRSLDRVMGKSFVEHWGYDLQMAVYGEVYRLNTGKDLETYLAVATKESPANIEIVHIPKWRREDLLGEIERTLPHIMAVRSGAIAPERCEVCEYCRNSKVLREPIDFELVGLSAYERRAILGQL